MATTLESLTIEQRGGQPQFPAPSDSHQWYLHKCGFTEVWADLDGVNANDPPIAIIDCGSTFHPEVIDRVENVPPLYGTPLVATHAGAVAGVIGAKRDADDNVEMAGCCSARMKLYNAWTVETGFNKDAYIAALEMVRGSGASVLNLSLGSSKEDPDIKAAIQDMIRTTDIVIVAAMGELDNLDLFPGSIPGVIAVGGTDRNDNALPSSGKGNHVFLAAPGEDIWTLFGDDDYKVWQGSSFSTAIVTAAVWLARRNKPNWVPQQIRTALQQSVAAGTAGNGRGYGRLDMRKLRALTYA